MTAGFRASLPSARGVPLQHGLELRFAREHKQHALCRFPAATMLQDPGGRGPGTDLRGAGWRYGGEAPAPYDQVPPEVDSPMARRTHDVVVVGGGIVGLACAYYLARAGAETVVVERGLPGAEQSVRTGGGIRLCHASAINLQLSKLSWPIWESFQEHFGVDPLLRNTGHLFLGRSEEAAETLRNQRRLHAELDLPSRFLESGDLDRGWPSLAGRGYEAGLFCPVGAYLDHHRAVRGLYHGALRAGAEVRVGVSVTGLIRSGKRIVGAESAEGSLPANEVVNCAGAYAGRIARMANLDLPVISRRHQLLVTQLKRPLPEPLPWLIDLDRQVHLRPDAPGRALIGGFLGEDRAVDPDRYDRSYDRTWAAKVRAVISEAFGLTEPDEVIARGWAGLYVGTPDYHPVIERSCPGLITAAGFSGTGLMHAPAVGMIVSELALSNEARSLDIDELASSRFRETSIRRDNSGF